MKPVLFIISLFILNTSFLEKKVDTYVSPFTVYREANYKDFKFEWVAVGDIVRIELRYSTNGVNYQIFYSSNDIVSPYSTRFNFKAMTYFVAVGISSTGEEFWSGIIPLQVGH